MKDCILVTGGEPEGLKAIPKYLAAEGFALVRVSDLMGITQEEGILRLHNPAGEVFFGKGENTSMERLLGLPPGVNRVTEIDVTRQNGGSGTVRIHVVDRSRKDEPVFMACKFKLVSKKIRIFQKNGDIFFCI